MPVSPLMTEAAAGTLPLNGTCVSSMPAMRSMRTAARCVIAPAPDDA